MDKDEALRLALEALEKLWNIIDDIDTYSDMAKADEKLYRSLVERRQRQRFEETGISTDGYELHGGAITAIKAALEAKDEPWTQDDMAYRPNGLPQEFIKHEVELPEDWSEWVCPNPDEYFMKCCDCGLVHEVQYRVARYGEGDYCELVNDKDVQAQFRMRRRTQPNPEVKNEKPWICECKADSYNACKCAIKSQPQRTWIGLTDDEIVLIVAECAASHQHTDIHFAKAIEAKLKEKNT